VCGGSIHTSEVLLFLALPHTKEKVLFQITGSELIEQLPVHYYSQSMDKEGRRKVKQTMLISENLFY